MLPSSAEAKHRLAVGQVTPVRLAAVPMPPPSQVELLTVLVPDTTAPLVPTATHVFMIGSGCACAVHEMALRSLLPPDCFTVQLFWSPVVPVITPAVPTA